MFPCDKARMWARGPRPRRAIPARWIVALILAAAQATAQLDRDADLQPPDLLELTGHVGKRFEHEPLGWGLKLGDGFTPTLYQFHLVEMRVLNSGRLPGSILDAVEPYTPNFRLFGTREQIAALAGATPEQPVKITGY